MKDDVGMAKKRYCIQRLVTYDAKQLLSEWKTTKYCKDDLTALYPFIGNEGYRIWDTVEYKVVRVKNL